MKGVSERLGKKFNFFNKTKRPGRDLNPGQKLRRLLGCPLPHRDVFTACFT
jgi:hypothetical protein